MDELSDPALYQRLYEQLRTLAHRERRRNGASPTLNTTALVHETYLNLRQQGHAEPRVFHAYAARAMRNLLVDEARKRARPKHGGDWQRDDLDAALDEAQVRESRRTLDLDEALTALAKVDPRAARVVELHYFAGMELVDIARQLSLSDRTVQRDWRAAKAWLKRELESD